MATKKKLLQAAAGAAGGGAALNVEDVFSTYLYTGNNSTQTITNGIDLAGEGGMVWIKERSTSGSDHGIHDTERGVKNPIFTNLTDAENSYYSTNNLGITSFNSNGFTVASGSNFNDSGDTAASWTFRKAPKFFDVVTYTGNGVSGRTVSHNLGSVPGCIFIKRTSSTEDWVVYHVGADATSPEDYYFKLNTTAARIDSTAAFNDTAPTSTEFTVGNNGDVNANGETFVAYLFAHNDGDGEFGPDGDADIIKCGSFTASAGNEVDLGFEPQWVIVKSTESTADWYMFDTMRGWGADQGSDDAWLSSNTNGAETNNTNSLGLTPTGFTSFNGGDDTYIYIAIRRGPMAVPESADEVFGVATRDATPPAFNTSFDVDMSIYQSNVTSPDDTFNSARIMQGDVLKTNTTDNAISGGTGFVYDYSRGWYGPTSANSNAYSWMWGRAPNFFDVVAYTGNGTASQTINHNLGVVPEMIWIKTRDNAPLNDNWIVYHKDRSADQKGWYLNATSAEQNVASISGTPTDTQMVVENQYTSNASGTYIAYLFASLAGVSKVGSYTGNGSSQTIDCGFSSGSRFVLIKGLTVATPWLLYDSTRGITSGNDPYILLDSKSGSSTTDYIDPDSSGFIVNNNVWVNNNGSDYIFYAIA
jgi:hypothetical protein